jgi:RNA polymerase sigma-70 factor (ECF subfamily)
MDKPSNETFVQLVNENSGIAHRVCRIYFEDPDDREDAFQEMMYQLWKAFPGFGGRSKFSTWMYRVCLNTALTYRRKTRQHRPEPISGVHHEIAAPTSSHNEDLVTLFRAIAMLSQLNKAIVLLYLDELSYEEIAEVTGISKANVSVRLVRIKKQLETIMNENDL